MHCIISEKYHGCVFCIVFFTVYLEKESRMRRGWREVVSSLIHNEVTGFLVPVFLLSGGTRNFPDIMRMHFLLDCLGRFLRLCVSIFDCDVYNKIGV